MYDSTPDPYCYPGTAVLKNRANIRDQAELDAFEHEAMLQRAETRLAESFWVGDFPALTRNRTGC